MLVDDLKWAEAANQVADLQRAVAAAQWELMRQTLAQGLTPSLIDGTPNLPSSPPPSVQPR